MQARCSELDVDSKGYIHHTVSGPNGKLRTPAREVREYRISLQMNKVKMNENEFSKLKGWSSDDIGSQQRCNKMFMSTCLLL